MVEFKLKARGYLEKTFDAAPNKMTVVTLALTENSQYRKEVMELIEEAIIRDSNGK